MKNKSLAIITASIITASALILTAGLSLLNSAAIDETLPESGAPIESVVETPEIPEDVSDVEVDVEADVEADTDEVILPDTEEEVENEESVSVYPDFEYAEGDAKTVYVDGDDVSNGVVIDVYSHKTGKLVGQLAFTSADISAYISSLMRIEFKPENELWIGEDVCQPLPEGDYRIEVYAGTWFSYTYGKSGIFELTQCTLTFAGGEALTGYIDYLIADYIAELEAGNVEAPAAEDAVSKLLYGGLEGYWEGYFNEVCQMYIPAAGRHCDRFPYLENE